MDGNKVFVVLSGMSRDREVFTVEAVCLTRHGAEARVAALAALRDPGDLMDQFWTVETDLRP